MRVLQVVPSLDAAQGGIRTSIHGVNRAMAAAGIEAECACVGEPNPPISGLKLHAFAPGAPARLRASADLRAWLFAHARDYDAVIAHTLWLSPTRYAIDAALQAGKPTLLMPHGMLDPDALAHHAWRKRLRWLFGEARRVRACTLVFSTPTDRDRALGTPHAFRLPACVIPNPVDDSWFNLLPARRKPEPEVLCLNRWHPRKGVLEFVQAMAFLHERGIAFHAHLAGNNEDAAYAGRVRAAAEPLVRAGCLTLHGLQGEAGVRELMSRADILVHPATGFENFGNVLAEAAAAGVACVGSVRALVSLELASGDAAIAVEPSVQSLADAIGGLLKDVTARQALGRRARAYASAHYSMGNVGAQWLRAIRSLVPA
jgi:glycosyltransferase involved in cell wall biosynthesis